MGRSVSYPSAAQVVTFNHIDYSCDECGSGTNTDIEDCEYCHGLGYDEDPEGWRFEQLIEDFRSHLKELFPSVEQADDWIGREDHVLAENKLARFGMSEYCGLVSYWVVPSMPDPRTTNHDAFADRWIASIADKFVAAFGELTKVGSLSNGEGVYRRIDKA
jgi:hypothetical protein